ncbi:MAG: hypothetical protein HLUCCO07_01635 [Rhodobacteraceae bacterium HLUCCO07]|nr:MAG: hypothetical protein HLUCCO07_01635 [Rhodobacteraceae bacterium HLUCCO07]
MTMFFMRPIRRIRPRLQRFASGQSGSVTIEAVIMLPILFWAFCALYTFFDAYRHTSIVHKTAYTISDAISRETNPIDDAYLDGQHGLMSFLTRSSSTHRMRVTVVRYDADDEEYHVEWSQTRGPVSAHPTGDAGALEEQLPTMADEERMIVVETWSDYEAPFRIGLDDTTIQTFVFTRPRFAPQVLFSAST